MTPEERKRWEDRQRERRKINSYAPLEALEKIAGENIIGMKTRISLHGLDSMFTDRKGEEDHFDVAVWEIKQALIAAYLLGKRDAERD